MHRSIAKVRAVLLSIAVIFGVAFWLAFTGEVNQAQLRKVALKFDVPAKFLTRDAVTDSIRSVSKDLVHVPVESGVDRSRAASLGKIVSDHRSFVIVSGNTGISAETYGDGAFKIDTTVHLPGKTFDPINTPPAETVHTGSPSKYGKGYYVVQLGDIATDEILDSIRGMGFEVLQYVPNNAFLVYGDAEDASRIAEHSRVRWIGAFTADQKISPELVGASTESKGGTAMYNIAVFSRVDLENAVGDVMNASGGTLIGKMTLQSSYFNVVRIAMNPEQLDAVASIPDVVRIDSYQFPTREDERAAQIVAGNYTNATTIAAPGYNPLTQFGFDGTNVTVAVADDGISIPGNGGFYLTSANTVDANLRGSTAGAGGGHGHLNASIIAGTTPFGNLDPLNYNYGLGIAPKAHIVNIAFLKAGYTGTDADGANDAVVTAGPNGVLGTISNNSWGFGLNGNVYESLAATYDALARDASAAGTVDPLLFVFSAGNSGGSGLTRPKMAKNIIATGSSENIRTELEPGSNNLDDMSSFSARGPAADGRIKPDIVAPGDTITGSRAGTCTSVTSCFETNHAWSEGTSHAAPQIAGVAALFTQWWKSTHAGANPSIAMTKAAILQTGQEMAGSGATNPLPNADEGWGRVNMKFLLNTGATMKHVDQTDQLFSPGSSFTYTGKVVDGTKPFRATLVWTDPAGIADPALVNNLDLRVVIGGTTFRGNNFSGGLSTAGGGPDFRNNVENVWRTGHATDTTVTITVSASSLNGNGIIGNADGTDQHFALVVYNYVDTAPTTVAVSVSGRVVSPNGRAVANAKVVLTNGPTVVATTYTSTFGYYTFIGIPGSTNYTATVSKKRYTFNTQAVNLVSSDLAGVNFTATSGSP